MSKIISMLWLVVLLPFDAANAEWKVYGEEGSASRAVFERTVSTTKGKADVGIMCAPQPVLLVDWGVKYEGIMIGIDGVDLNEFQQARLKTGSQLIAIGEYGIQKLLSGIEMSLRAIPLFGDKEHAVVSLLGLSDAVQDAGLNCIKIQTSADIQAELLVLREQVLEGFNSGFKTEFHKFKESLDQITEESGWTLFTRVENMGDGTIELYAADDWNELDQEDQKKILKSFTEMWVKFEGSGNPVVVGIVDENGVRKMTGNGQFSK